MRARRDINVGVLTIDRTPSANYLAETLVNLKRGGIETSLRVGHVSVFDGGGYQSAEWASGVVARVGLSSRADVCGFSERKPANINVATLLSSLAAWPGRWVLMLEDDIDVCGLFFDSVGEWLDEYASEEHRIYPLGANYPQVDTVAESGEGAWRYPADKFYGTQALAIRPGDARSLSRYLVERCYDRTDDGSAYDLLMADWLRVEYPDAPNLLTPAPSLVQHIGRTSSIRPRPNTHTFPSWRGREWSYRQTERKEA